MEAVEVDCDVNVYHVAVLQRSAICASDSKHQFSFREQGHKSGGLNSSGMPCTRILLTLVQHDFGNPL